MNQYKILIHPSGLTEAVKQGWSWPAFFFTYMWAMVKKMWVLGVALLISSLFLGFLSGAFDGGFGGSVLMNSLWFVVIVVFGMQGNSWRENNLISRGYEYVATMEADNPEAAIALHLKSRK